MPMDLHLDAIPDAILIHSLDIDHAPSIPIGSQAERVLDNNVINMRSGGSAVGITSITRRGISVLPSRDFSRRAPRVG